MKAGAKTAAKVAAKVEKDAAKHALKVREVDEALRAALVRQAALTGKVERARAKLVAQHEEIEQVKAELRAHADPRMAALRARDRALHALFVELATDKRRRVRVRREIEALHAELSDDTVLSSYGYAEAWAAVRGQPAPVGGHRDGPRFEPGERGPDDEDEEEVASAPRGDDSLRGLFRRLVEALHPDKVQDPEAKTARTEVMKQVTVAYREGDLARLLELERSWVAQVAAPTDDEQARRLALIEQANADLEDELRDLERTRKALRRGPARDLLRAVGPMEGRAERVAGVAAEVCRGMDRDLAQLDAFHDHLVAYRDGKISLEALIVGPGSRDVDDLLAEVERLASMAPRGRVKKPARARRR